MEKIEEKSFVDILVDDLKKIYNFLSECKVKNYSQILPTIWVKFDCKEALYSATYSEKGIFPILIDNSSYEERAKTSFKSSIGLEITEISRFNNTVYIYSSFDPDEKIKAEYTFEDLPHAIIFVECSKNKINTCISKYVKYFIFPPSVEMNDIKFLSKKDLFNLNKFQRSILTYRIDGKVVFIETYETDEKIRIVNAKTKDEGMII